MSRDDTNKKFWEVVAKLYTPIIEKRNKTLYQDLCDEISKILTKDMQVLELACGTGQLTFSLSKKVCSWEATDFSEKMISEAKKREKVDNLSFAVQDATNLQYNSGMFDTVIIANALHIMPNPEKALSEIKRVLKTNGVLIAPTFVYDGKNNKFIISIFEKLGFRTYHKWKSTEFTDFIIKNGFVIEETKLINGNFLPEFLVICRSK